jgi:hypothetical protein
MTDESEDDEVELWSVVPLDVVVARRGRSSVCQD